MNEAEERFYEIAASEIANKSTVPGLMARAFADADGDEKKTIAKYIKLRVAQLQAELAQEITRRREAQRREQQAEEAMQARRRAGIQRKQNGTYSCPCGYDGRFKNESETNVWLFLLLLCLGVIPGILYSTGTVKMVCPRCGAISRK
jgi:predicted RNA-binding Zn-ribbon protein involved in translation (DUF1610 family)